jgi:hypothetical protein
LVPPAGNGTYCAVRDVFAMRDVILVVRFTRHWIHYGVMTHIAVCVLIAAVEGLLGR